MLVDTNVLLRSVQQGHQQQRLAVAAIQRLLQQGFSLVVAIQNLAEFWNVATRPVSANGFGLSVEQALAQMTSFEPFIAILPERPDTYQNWKSLVSGLGVSGVQAHDARLVAVMRSYGIDSILTFDRKDFVRFHGIRVFDPESVIANQ